MSVFTKKMADLLTAKGLGKNLLWENYAAPHKKLNYRPNYEEKMRSYKGFILRLT